MDTDNSSTLAQPPSPVQSLMQHVEALVPHSLESSVSTKELYLDDSGKERLIITILRFPNGSPGQVRFDYRASANSKLIDYDIKSSLMEEYNMSPESKPEDMSQRLLETEEAAIWLIGLIERGKEAKS